MSEVEPGAATAAPQENAIASTPETPTKVEVVETAKPTMEETMSAVFDKLNPQERVKRAEDGKFTSETVETQEAAPEEPNSDQTQTEEKTEPPTAAIDPPQSWSAEMKAKWATFSPEDQAYFLKREGEAHKRITELGETAKASEQIRSVVERYRNTFKGQDPAQAIEKLAAASDFLDRDPMGGIKWLADAYGVDLSTFVKPAEGGEGQQTEYIRSLEARVARAEKLAAEANNSVKSREQRETEAHQQSIAKLVDDFAKDKTHWADIENDVYAQIHAVIVADPNLPPDKILEKAYDRALKLNETVQAKLAADKKAADEAKAKAEAAKKATEAKKLATLNVKSTKGASPKAQGKWEDTMREVGERLMG